MRAKVQGSVWLECIVMPDGSVGEVKVTRSLDPIFGLDQEAIKAAKMWSFRPGMRQGEPVPVIITIELTFTASVIDCAMKRILLGLAFALFPSTHRRSPPRFPRRSRAISSRAISLSRAASACPR